MRRKTTIFVTAFLLAILCGCTGGDMLAELERLEEQNRSDQPFTSDSAARRIVDYYDRWYRLPTAANHNLQMRAYYMLGSAYRDMGEAPKALEYFQHAAEIADTTSKDCDFDRLMRIHSQMSELYASQRLLDEEQIELDNAEQLAWRIKDTLSALIFEEYKCHSLYNKGKYGKCIEKTIELSQRYREYGYLEESLLAYTYCINSCLGLGDYSRMRSFIEQYEHCSYLHNAPQKVAGGPSALYIFKGQYYLGTQRPDSAVYFFNKALPYIHKGTGELLAYKGLFQSYNLQHKADSVLKYTQLYSDAKERNFNFEVTEATLRTKSLYDYTQEQNIAIQKTRDAQISHYIIVLLFGSLAIIVISSLLVYNGIRQRRLKEELEYRRLVEEHMAIQIKCQNQEEQICTFRQDVIEKEAQLGKEDIVVYFHEMAQNRYNGNLPTKKDWQKLIRTYSRYMPHIYARMQVAKLTDREQYACILAHLDFSASDLTVLLDTSKQIVSNARLSAKRKLFGCESDISLVQSLKKCAYFQM